MYGEREVRRKEVERIRINSRTHGCWDGGREGVSKNVDLLVFFQSTYPSTHHTPIPSFTLSHVPTPPFPNPPQ